MNEKRLCRVALNLALFNRRKLATKLEALHPDPAQALEACLEGQAKLGLSAEERRRLFPPDLLERGRREMEDAERGGFKILTREDGAYPPGLGEAFDPPSVLYVRGRTDVLADPCLAIVGARKPTPYGRAMAQSLAREAARSGMTVVSGLAVGIDTQAHWGALEGGRTIAVLGSGLDVIYPPLNRALSAKIAENGAVISELPLGSQPLGFHFPLRNRIISGLSLAVVVVEATLRSGSLITAQLALEQNREVMAVPGNATSDLSAGSNWLIQCGAKLVRRWADIFDELPDHVRARLAPVASPGDERGERRPETADLSPGEAKVLAVLKPDALTSVDELVEATDYSVSEVLSTLLGLELKSAVLQGPGQRYLRRA